VPDTETTQTSPQAGTTDTSPTAGAGDVSQGQEPRTFDADYVSKLRAEAAAHRKEASELKSKVKEFEDAKLSETERLTKAAQEAQDLARTASEKASQRITRALLIAEASTLGFADPADATALIDARSIERDEDGEPTNLEKLLGDLAKAKPYLLGGESGTNRSPHVGATNPARTGVRSGSSFTTSQIADRAFWTANREAIMAAMREGRIVEG